MKGVCDLKRGLGHSTIIRKRERFIDYRNVRIRIRNEMSFLIATPRRISLLLTLFNTGSAQTETDTWWLEECFEHRDHDFLRIFFLSVVLCTPGDINSFRTTRMIRRYIEFCFLFFFFTNKCAVFDKSSGNLKNKKIYFVYFLSRNKKIAYQFRIYFQSMIKCRMGFFFSQTAYSGIYQVWIVFFFFFKLIDSVAAGC